MKKIGAPHFLCSCPPVKQQVPETGTVELLPCSQSLYRLTAIMASANQHFYFCAQMRTILVIEDDEALRENYAELLSIHQYNVLTAKNGWIGYNIARTSLPDLILCDMVMPNSDGCKFLELARADADLQKIPVICFSADSCLPRHLQRLTTDYNGFLKKPFREKQLLFEIARFL